LQGAQADLAQSAFKYVKFFQSLCCQRQLDGKILVRVGSDSFRKLGLD
jgi:hypothetical protein